MDYELFKEELDCITRNQAILDQGQIRSKQVAEQYAGLLKSYEKLFKATRRLMRLSDRNEKKLKSVTRSLDDKNCTLEELSGKLARYLSPQVVDSILSGRQQAEIATERKKLTVFFSDIKDFTETTDDLEAEDLTFLVNDYFTEMSAIALEYGATIDKFIGDAMLMFFGDPETLGAREDAVACVRMAIAMQHKLEDLRHRWRGMGFEKPFRMRIGISTGYCNVGNFGSADRMDYTIIGGEVNLASRLESQAEPGGIVLAYETYALVSDIIHAEEQPPIQVKGFRRPIRPFALVGLYDDLTGNRRYIHQERDGMKLLIDLDKLAPDERAAVAASLEAAADELKSS